MRRLGLRLRGVFALNGYYLKADGYGHIKRILLVATGALLSPTSTQQGESIPGVAHAVAIETE